MSDRDIEESFLGLPLRTLADAALARARELGASHADLRVERIRSQNLRLRDASLEGRRDDEDTGFAVRVVHEGTWGFAAGVDLTPEAAVRVAEQAVAIARASRPINREPVELADEPVYGDVRWISAYDVNPFDVPDGDKVALLADRSHRLLSAEGIDHVDAGVDQVLENKFYADLAGTVTTQQRVRIQPSLRAVRVDPESGQFETMDSLAPPVGRGWEFLTGTGWDWDAEIS
ncbi:MAG: TldD protein, partial [Actinomycetota bacterium]|nr:TldD protein [Actinomycetota bacterium]